MDGQGQAGVPASAPKARKESAIDAQANALSSTLQSISFHDAQRDPTILDPSSSSKGLQGNATESQGRRDRPRGRGDWGLKKDKPTQRRRAPEEGSWRSTVTAGAETRDMVDQATGEMALKRVTNGDKPKPKKKRNPKAKGDATAATNGEQPATDGAAPPAPPVQGEPTTNGQAAISRSSKRRKRRNSLKSAERPQVAVNGTGAHPEPSQSSPEIDGKAKTDRIQAAGVDPTQISHAISRAVRLRVIEEQHNNLALQVARALRQSSWQGDGEQGDEALRRHRNLGGLAWALFQCTRPSETSLRARNELIRDVERALNRRWRGCHLKVKPFGSTLTGLVEEASDLDLCLLDPTRPQGVGTPIEHVLPLPEDAQYELLNNPRVMGMTGVPDYYNVNMIARALDRHYGHFYEVVPIRHAKVPIVKFAHSVSNLACDLNVNDSFGLRNSEMIRCYIDIAPDIVAPMLYFVKKWASKRQINDPSGKEGMVSFNSYTLCLFALQYLQIRGIVPNLQSSRLIRLCEVTPDHLWQRPKGKSVAEAVANVVDGATQQPRIEQDGRTGARLFDTTFCRLDTVEQREVAAEQAALDPMGVREPFSIARTKDLDEASKARLLGSLLDGFYRWFAAFDFRHCGFSLRLGQPFRRIAVLTSPDGNDLSDYPYVEPWDDEWRERSVICQDPFILDRNTCAAVNPVAFEVILGEFRRAIELLDRHTSSSTLSATDMAALLIDLEYEALMEVQEERMARLPDHIHEQIATEARRRFDRGQLAVTHKKVTNLRARQVQKEYEREREYQKQKQRRAQTLEGERAALEQPQAEQDDGGDKQEGSIEQNGTISETTFGTTGMTQAMDDLLSDGHDDEEGTVSVTVQPDARQLDEAMSEDIREINGASEQLQVGI